MLNSSERKLVIRLFSCFPSALIRRSGYIYSQTGGATNIFLFSLRLDPPLWIYLQSNWWRNQHFPVSLRLDPPLCIYIYSQTGGATNICQ